jgi:hypothetical protein
MFRRCTQTRSAFIVDDIGSTSAFRADAERERQHLNRSKGLVAGQGPKREPNVHWLTSIEALEIRLPALQSSAG